MHTRLLISIAWLLLLHVHVFGQSNSSIESLQKKLKEEKLPAQRAVYLEQLSQAFDPLNADSALRYAELALAQAQQTTDDSLIFNALKRISGAYYDKKQKKATLAFAQQALELARSIGDSVKVAQALRLQALSIPAISRAEAIRLIRYANAILPDTTKKLRRAAMLNDDYLAYLLKYKQPEEAFRMQKEVLQQAFELQDSAQIAASYAHLGMYYRNTSVDSALYYFRLARNGFLRQNNVSRLADNAAKLATCFQLKDMADSVLFYAQLAIRLGKETASISPQRQGLKTILSHYRESEDNEKALTYAEEVLALEQAHPSGYLSMIWIDFGSIYQEQGELDKAKDYFQRALDQASKDKYPPGIATANAYLGEVALTEKKYEVAETYIRQADQLYERMGISAARSRTFQRLGEIAFARQNFRQASDYFEQLLSLSDSLVDISGQATAQRSLAQCDSANGNLASAYVHMLAYAKLQMTFSQQNYDKEVAMLETSFEAERREARNQALEQENKIQGLELQTSRSQNSFLLVIAIVMGTALAAIFLLYARLRTSNKQIEAQASALRELNQTKDRLFGIIAHDLRGPLTGFQSLGKIFSHHLKAGNTAKLEAISDRIKVQSVQLKNLLDNLLQWSLQQLGSYRPQWEEILLKTLGDEVVALYAESSAVKENEIELEIPADLQVKVDKNGLRVVLNNLLNNAIKFTDKGKIRLLADKQADQLMIEIADTGQGMSKTQLADFEANGSLTSRQGTAGERGTGLGLSLVKQLIQRWGGEIKIQSKMQEGTRIQLNLPVIE